MALTEFNSQLIADVGISMGDEGKGRIVYEIIDELFTVGIVVSDTHLLTLVKKRLTPELLKQIWNDGEEMA